MKTSKEFFERLQSDEEFAKEVAEKAKEKVDAGETDYKAIWIPIAAEYDYEIKGEELDELYSKATVALSEEDLGKVAGGTSPLTLTIGIASTVATISVAITTQFA